MNRFPKRLIEVDLPIARISEHARKDKTGSISTLHIWWARRPLSACRAVICAALWPDPADELCPQSFRDAAAKHLTAFANRVFPSCLSAAAHHLRHKRHATERGLEIWQEWAEATRTQSLEHDLVAVRNGLLNFIAEFAIRENSTVAAFLETSRALTDAAHAALTGFTGGRPLVADPFAGGGAIPLEALRVGADSFASDLNPVPVLLNRVVLELIPRFGKQLPQWLKQWGDWIGEQLQTELTRFYPQHNGQQPVNYLWARTILCEGPQCGVEIPLLRSPWLARKDGRQCLLRLRPQADLKRIDLQIIAKRGDDWVDVADSSHVISSTEISFAGTVKGGAVTCPCCGYTTPVTRVRSQLQSRGGGSRDARLVCVITTEPGRIGKNYYLPGATDFEAVRRAAERLNELAQDSPFGFAAIPDEPTPTDGTGSKGGGYRTRKYGVTTYGDFFNARQLVQHLTISALVRRLKAACAKELSPEEVDAVQTLIALTANRQIDRDSAFCRWNPNGQASAYTFGRQAIPMLWDYVESPALFAAGGWNVCLSNTIKTIEELAAVLEGTGAGQSQQASATQHPLPDEACSCIVTDPPYYDAVPYAELSDFFFVWLKRSLGDRPLIHQFQTLTRRDVECVVNLNEGKDKAYFQRTMTQCLTEARRICSPEGIAVVVFAHKTTAGWESQLQAMLDAGWIVTASWPLDTEMANRLRALNSAALNSSIHLVCRPRSADSQNNVGEWRDVLLELPQRIREWMPRLADEGVVGADAIFACLGPALEVFSRYARVEKANGEPATLKEYLEFVWFAVSTEALTLIFKDADAAGLEPDARLTAVWLWTVTKASSSKFAALEDSESDEAEDDDDDVPASHSGSALSLDCDSARKLAQGLGVSLEQCRSIIEVQGDKARLIPVAERRLPVVTDITASANGGTQLDRVHQAMQLFSMGRSEAVKQFLVEGRVGEDPRFWKLAQALSALYPPDSHEKRWVDGVLARKKGLGF